jgi:hypothetical protein
MRKIIIGISLILALPHLVYSIGDGYHIGNSLEFGDPQSSFVGLFYEDGKIDSLTLSNQRFLSEYMKLKGHTPLAPEDFSPGRRYKLVMLDSVFISNYYEGNHCSFKSSEYILNDLKSGGQFELYDFGRNDFNELISRQTFTEPIDYLLLAKLYEVLSSFEYSIDFVRSEYDVEFAYDRDMIWADEKESSAIMDICKNKIEAPKIEFADNKYFVTFYTYSSYSMNVEKTTIAFWGREIVHEDSRLVVSGDEIRKYVYKKTK